MRSLRLDTRQSSFACLLLLSSFQLPFTVAFTQCYYPDGSIPTDYVWEPCTGAEFSSCCIPAEGDVCQDNGLCFYPNNNHTFRGTCSDRTWNDPACLSDICVTGSEDTWQWVTTCDNGGSSSFACGKISEEDGGHKTANCSAGATEFTNFRTEALSTSKPTRYTPPPTLDPSLYTVFTSEYKTVITATVADTTITTSWESTITSTFSHSSSTRSATGIAAGITSGAGTSVPTSSSNNSITKGKVTISASVLAGAIAGPVVLLGLLAGLFFFLRKRRALNKAGGLHTPLDSSSSPPPQPPPNGPVGSHQVTPYEVAASEAKFQPGSGSGIGEKHVYTGSTTRRGDEGYYNNDNNHSNNNAYEMGSGGGAAHNEKGWYGNAFHVAEVEGDVSRPGTAVPLPSPLQQQYQQQHQQQQYQQQQQQHQQYYQAYSPGQQILHSPGGVRSPAPVYSENNGPAVMPIELDGTGSVRGAGR